MITMQVGQKWTDRAYIERGGCGVRRTVEVTDAGPGLARVRVVGEKVKGKAANLGNFRSRMGEELVVTFDYAAAGLALTSGGNEQ